MGNEIEILVKVKDQATAEIAAIAAKARAATAASGTSGASNAIEVPIQADASKLEQDVEQKVKRVKKPDPIEVPVETDAEKFERELRASFAEGEKNAQEAEKAMNQSFTAMEHGLRTLQSAMKELAKPIEDAGTAADDFETEFRKAMQGGERVSADADRALRQSFTSIESGSRTLRTAMADLAPAADKAGSALENAGNKADAAGKKASESGNGFNLGALKMTGMMSAALALAPALAALPAVGAAITVGIGTMSLGLGGVVSALKDYGQASGGAGQSGAQMAQTAFSNAVAIRNAEQAIADAKKQAAVAAQSSADQIYSAQERVAQSAYSLQQAEQSLADAEKSAEDTQKALTQARADAANQLIDLNNAAADSNISVQQAQLNLTEAQEKLTAVTNSGLSTDDQKRQAQIDLLSATQALKDAQQKQVESRQQADAANKTGVNGMQGVVSAQDAVKKATEGVTSAQHGVASAAQAQTDAQTALARAIQASSRQQADSAQAIQKAVQNLSDTYEQQKLAADAAASAGGGAANKFAQDMAKLTPAGQAFVTQLLAMRSGVDELKNTAQTTMLPGLTQMLKDSAPLLPTFNTAIGNMGTIIGNTAKQFGQLMQSPAFQGQLTQVLKEGSDLAGTFASGLTGMVSGIMQAAANAGPIVTGIGDGIKTLMTSGIPDFLSGLTTNATQIGQAFQGVLTLVSNLAGPLGTVAGAVATALAPGIQVLASPAVQQALQSIGASLAQIIIALSPVVTMLAQGLAGALRIAAPLLQSLAKFIQDNQRWIVPLAQAITIATIAFWGLNAALDANPIVLIIAGISALVLGLIYAWEHFKGFRDFVKQMWRDIKIGFDDFLGFITTWWPELLAPFTGGASLIVGHWNSIVDFTKKLPGRLAAAAVGLWDWVTQEWDKYIAGPISKSFDALITAVTGLPGRVSSAAKGLWDPIWNGFTGIYNDIANAWNNLSFTLPGLDLGPLGKIGGFTIGIPSWADIPTIHAFGGVLTGGLTGIVGDAGIEALRLPNGTQVMPNANTKSMLAQGAGMGGAAHIKLSWDDSGAAAGDEILTWLKRRIRASFGNDPNSAQKTLGQAF